MGSSLQGSLDQLRIPITELSRKQVELRGLIRVHLTETGLTVNSFALKTGARKQSLELFLEKRQVLVSTGLESIGAAIGAEGLCQEIVELAKKIPDRYMGLAGFDEAVIGIVCDLFATWKSQPVDYTGAEFAAAFPKLEEVVAGALVCSKDALFTLRDHPETIPALLDLLLDEDFEKRLQQAKESRVRAQQVKIEQIEQLVNELWPQFGDKQSLMQKLGLARGSLNRSKLVCASDAQLDLFITKLCEARDVKIEAPPQEKPTEPTRVDPFRGLAGGGNYILTEENFREIEGLPVVALIQSLVTSVRMTRGILALVAQQKGGAVRAQMGQPLVLRELRELYLALELASAADPEGLLLLMSGHRERWESLGYSTDKRSR